jgi:hypothetical protein
LRFRSTQIERTLQGVGVQVHTGTFNPAFFHALDESRKIRNIHEIGATATDPIEMGIVWCNNKTGFAELMVWILARKAPDDITDVAATLQHWVDGLSSNRAFNQV